VRTAHLCAFVPKISLFSLSPCWCPMCWRRRPGRPSGTRGEGGGGGRNGRDKGEKKEGLLILPPVGYCFPYYSKFWHAIMVSIGPALREVGGMKEKKERKRKRPRKIKRVVKTFCAGGQRHAASSAMHFNCPLRCGIRRRLPRPTQRGGGGEKQQKTLGSFRPFRRPDSPLCLCFVTPPHPVDEERGKRRGLREEEEKGRAERKKGPAWCAGCPHSHPLALLSQCPAALLYEIGSFERSAGRWWRKGKKGKGKKSEKG